MTTPSSRTRKEIEPVATKKTENWKFVAAAMIHMLPIIAVCTGAAWGVYAWISGIRGVEFVKGLLGVVGITSGLGIVLTVSAATGLPIYERVRERRREWDIQNDPSKGPFVRSALQLNEALRILPDFIESFPGTQLSDAASRLCDIAADGWNHNDPMFQRLSRDTAATASVMAAVFDDETIDRQALLTEATAAFTLLADAAEQERGNAADAGIERAATQTRYLRAAYGVIDGLEVPRRDTEHPIPLVDKSTPE